MHHTGWFERPGPSPRTCSTLNYLEHHVSHDALSDDAVRSGRGAFIKAADRALAALAGSDGVSGRGDCRVSPSAIQDLDQAQPMRGPVRWLEARRNLNFRQITRGAKASTAIPVSPPVPVPAKVCAACSLGFNPLLLARIAMASAPRRRRSTRSGATTGAIILPLRTRRSITIWSCAVRPFLQGMPARSFRGKRPIGASPKL